MSLITIKESAAATAVGTDLIATLAAQWSQSPNLRRVTRAALVGSAAAGDAQVQIWYGQTLIASLYNSTAGAVVPVEAKDYINIPSRMVCERGEALRAVISDASATNALILVLETEEY